MIKIFKDAEQLSTAGAELFVQTAKQAIQERGRFTVALTGGSSPVKLYKLLAKPHYAEQIDWHQVFIFWGDERWVPLDDEKSNAKMAFETLLNHLPIPKDQIFPMWKDEVTPKDFAKEYTQTLRQQLGAPMRFDLILLGMGDDGHTASLFPGTAVLKEESIAVKAYFLAPQEMYRITLTAPLINQARKVAFIVYGSNKAHALHEVLAGNEDSSTYPTQLIHPVNGETWWLLDSAAASKLTEQNG